MNPAFSPLHVEQCIIPDVLRLLPTRHEDARGFVWETYSRHVYEAAGVTCEFVQDNHSRSVRPGVVRGLHFQIPPCAQDKLIWCTRGAIFDVAVDIRRGSPTYGRSVTMALDAGTCCQLFIPAGFAHGVCTLEANTEVIYKLSHRYSPEHSRGLLWNDPALGILWPVALESAIMSAADRQLPSLAELPPFFSWRA